LNWQKLPPATTPKMVAIVLATTALPTSTAIFRPVTFLAVTLGMIAGSWIAGRRVTTLLPKMLLPWTIAEACGRAGAASQVSLKDLGQCVAVTKAGDAVDPDSAALDIPRAQVLAGGDRPRRSYHRAPNLPYCSAIHRNRLASRPDTNS